MTGGRDSNPGTLHLSLSRGNSSQVPMTIAMGKPLITYSLLVVDGIRGDYEGRQHSVTVLLAISGLHHTHRHMTMTW